MKKKIYLWDLLPIHKRIWKLIPNWIYKKAWLNKYEKDGALY